MRLQLVGNDTIPNSNSGARTPEDTELVPNTVDLAQSFLETQPAKDRKDLEDALAAETQDLGASLSVSDDGSEDEIQYGTGQTLSLPTFMADFLQGIVDRVQVRIKAVTFDLDLDVPLEVSSTASDPITVQVYIDSIDVEGVTAPLASTDGLPSFVTQEGKRRVGLNDVRACLITEAAVFTSLVQSTSPSLVSSPTMTRNPPSREATVAVEPPNMESSVASLDERDAALLRSLDEAPPYDHFPLSDSEDALAIPYDLEDEDPKQAEEDPPTPRASMYHSTSLSDEAASQPFGDIEEQLWESAHSESPFDRAIRANSGISGSLDHYAADPSSATERAEDSSSTGHSTSSLPQVEDLSQSHLYTHEDAESMYLSAFSNKDQQSAIDSDDAQEGPTSPPEMVSDSPPLMSEHRLLRKQTMPGAWDEEQEADLASPAFSTHSKNSAPETQAAAGTDNQAQPFNAQEGETAETGDSAKAKPEEATRPEVDLEDVSTPRGPTRLAKEILRLQQLDIHIPRDHHHIQIHEVSNESVSHLSYSLDRSHHPQAPGAFSTRLPPAPLGADTHDAAGRGESDEQDHTLDIACSPVTLSFDASLAFLLAMITSKLLDATNRTQATTAPTQTEVKNVSHTPPFSLSLEEISINFLNRVNGIADNAERHLDTNAFSFHQDQEVLLNATVSKLSLRSAQAAKLQRNDRATSDHETTVSTIQIEKFRFGYATGNIVSFDGTIPMSTSVRDAFVSAGCDISVKILQTASGTRTDIETLPLAVSIDLQRLDETFGWFGGLSSFLNMGASIASASPPIKPTPPAATTPRGVRFDTPIDPNDKTASSQNKMNVRLGGASLELRGKDCSVLARSSAVKIVSRNEGLGLAISKMQLSGPYLYNSMADPSVMVDLSGVRLDFLNTPRDSDLDRLVGLIVPSKAKFDRNHDELMLDTLLRQRRKGSVLKVAVDLVDTRVSNLAQLVVLPNLFEEINKLSTVAKYLPEDDRPGLLTLFAINQISFSVRLEGQLGHFEGGIKDLGIAHITFPSLVAIAIAHIVVNRNTSEKLINTSTFDTGPIASKDPVIMARMIGGEIEPVVKVKLQNLEVEYRVSTMLDLLGLEADATPQDFEQGLAASIADLGDHAHSALLRQPSPSVQVATSTTKSPAPPKVDVEFHDCVLGLNPHRLKSKMSIVLMDAHLNVSLSHETDTHAELAIQKASILLIDDLEQRQMNNHTTSYSRRDSTSSSRQVIELSSRGFVEVSFTSSAHVVVDVSAGADGEKQVNVDLRDDLLVLQTCADSTQTLIAVANALKPPTPPAKESKYRTKVVPVQDLLASISAEAFGKPEGEYDFDQDFAGAQEMAGSDSDVDYSGESSLRVDSQYYDHEPQGEELFDATKASGISEVPGMEETNEGVLLTGFTRTSSGGLSSDDDLEIHDGFYSAGVEREHVAKVWNSGKNTYDQAPAKLVAHSPLKVSVRDVHLIWNLFDGYDWQETRDVISKAVEEVEARAIERQGQSPAIYEEEIDDEETIGDCLFNSIYIGIPANRDPHELSRAINEGIHDNATETESVAPTTVTASTNRTVRAPRSGRKRLRLQRSKRHKIAFELSGVNIDLLAFPPDSGETLSSIDVRIGKLDIFDHVPTSTWRKFATYDQDQGEREMGTSMVHLEILTVKPLPELAASEFVIRATLLPLRLHVDQDALDFITRFFEFKDDKVPVHASPSDVPFVQRIEVKDIPVKMDFKPKRVDYAGLRSGHTTEFMNFIVLEEARMVLRHVIIYGVSGFDRVGKTLNDIWMPDVRNNQLKGVLAGLAPMRSLANIGSGFKNLVEIPLKEYQKDGRVFRSISKGAAAFARTTGTEIVKLGAKLAVGTQYALQGAEGMLADQPGQSSGHWDDEDLDEEDRKQISLYADQPTGVVQGLRGGYRSLTRDVNLARDAIIAVPGEIMQSPSPGGAARAVLRKAPTIIFRPAMGVTKAIGQTLMGATNSMDPQNKRRIDEVSVRSGVPGFRTRLLTSNRNTRNTSTDRRSRMTGQYESRPQRL